MNQTGTYILIFFFGTLWGSFFYTLALRYSDKKYKNQFLKIFYTGSACPECNKKINPFFLVPLLGYLFALGKCRKCKKTISPLYPLYEIIYGIVAVIVYKKLFQISFYSFTIFMILALALTIAIIDFRTMIIPDSLVIAFFIISIYPIIKHNDYSENIYGFLLMSIVFLIVMIAFPGGFGGGDLKFASVIGLLLGFDLAVIALESALISGAITGTAYGLITRKGLKIHIPFGPFLVLGLFTAFFYGREIIFQYGQLIN